MHCKSILIVEDEDIIRESIKTLLELEGYVVFSANNGKDGLEVLKTMPRPCLILLDLLMPVMNGMEFLEVSNKEDIVGSIPVCIVSGVSEQPDSVKKGKGIEFIKKPIDFDGLLKFVKKYCHQ